MNADQVPASLRERPQWVAWRSEERDGKPTKVPYRAPGARARANDPSTWTSFAAASAAALSWADGIGFVFTESDPFCGIDLDACGDGNDLHPAALELIAELDSYSEWSPSRTGVHVIVQARLNGSRHRTGDVLWRDDAAYDPDGRAGLEAYASGRFFCVTGDALADGEPLPRQEQLDALVARFLPPREREERQASGNGTGALSDDEVIALARGARNSQKFLALWSGSTTGYASASEADLALCGVLKFWTQDPGQLARLFTRSGLHRSKHDRDDYVRRTVDRALAGGGDTYSGAPPDPDPDPGVADPGSASNGRVQPWSTLEEIAASLPPEPPWLVKGYLGAGAITMLAGAPKAGKSTLGLYLAHALQKGSAVLGQPANGKSDFCLLTEESGFTLVEKMLDLGLSGKQALCLMIQDRAPQAWPELVAEAVDVCTTSGVGFLIVDPLAMWAQFAGESENHAGPVLEAFEALKGARAANLCVLLIHHARKGGGKHGEGIRGSSAFAGAADILLELHHATDEAGGPRVLKAESRAQFVPGPLGLVKRDGGFDIVNDVGSLRPPSQSEAAILEQLAGQPVTAQQVADGCGLTPQYVQSRLRAMVAAGVARRAGSTGSGAHLYAAAP